MVVGFSGGGVVGYFYVFFRGIIVILLGGKER